MVEAERAIKQEAHGIIADLLEEAAREIERLQKKNWELTQYRDHTERMLALFEALPRNRASLEQVGLIDLVFKLRRVAESYREPLKEEDRNGND